MQNGFTLIELVIVLVILSVASVPLFGLFTQASTSMLANERIQTAAQLAQEHAELLLALRREQGYSDAAIAAGTTNEVLAGNYTGYTRRTEIVEPFGGPGCPGGATCKEVVVSVDEGGSTRAQVTFILVNY
jgi:prepilin-type N-terminal cleavage/methylation domain-containing protein